MKRALIALFVLGTLGAGGWVYYVRRPPPEAQVNTAPATSGDIVDTVGATGTLQAVTTVQIGSQVSGIIEWLGVDFNSIVRKGQVIARLDPSLLQAQVEQARANLTRSRADLERSRVQLTDAQTKYKRATELAERNLLPPSELDSAKVAVDLAQAQLQSSQAQVVQAEATVHQNEVNIEHTEIAAPIDGIVIQRSVDVGQTVAASLQSPTLFIIAADLTKMQVSANIDEADVGRIRPGQNITFRVDAYPGEEFGGTVAQVRLQPVVVQNVTTYGTIIDVPNTELKLKPGMTANLRVQIARRTDVVRIPNAALRFRPSADVFAALNQEPLPDAQFGGGRGGGGRRGANGPAAGASGQGAAAGNTRPQNANGTAAAQRGAAPSGPAAQGTPSARGAAPTDGAARQRGNASATPGEPQSPDNENAPGTGPFRGRFGRGLGQGAAPEGENPFRRDGANGEGGRQSGGGDSQGRGGFARGGDGTQGGGRRGEGGGRGQVGGNGADRQARLLEQFRNMDPAQQAQFLEGMKARGQDVSIFERSAQPRTATQTRAAASASRETPRTAQTIDALFAPLPPVETRGRVWLFVDKQLKPVNLRLGITDGTNTELLSGEIEAGTELVTGVVTGSVRQAPGAPGAGGANPLFPGGGRGPGGGGFGAPGGRGRG